jgi:hypothetical protein
MKTAPNEAEVRNPFRELGETGQNRLLDVARALFFAVKTRHPEGRPSKCGEPKSGKPGPNSPERADHSDTLITLTGGGVADGTLKRIGD